MNGSCKNLNRRYTHTYVHNCQTTMLKGTFERMYLSKLQCYGVYLSIQCYTHTVEPFQCLSPYQNFTCALRIYRWVGYLNSQVVGYNIPAVTIETLVQVVIGKYKTTKSVVHGNRRTAYTVVHTVTNRDIHCTVLMYSTVMTNVLTVGTVRKVNRRLTCTYVHYMYSEIRAY